MTFQILKKQSIPNHFRDMNFIESINSLVSKGVFQIVELIKVFVKKFEN